MGNKNRTCQENGTWTGSDPTCAEGLFYDMHSEVLIYVEKGWKEKKYVLVGKYKCKISKSESFST